jgi:hypothetical protein
MARELGFWDYALAAVTWRVPVKGLGNVRLNLAVLGLFALAGILNPGFWLLGAALEAGYVLFLAGNDRFQKLVQALEVARRTGRAVRRGGKTAERQADLLEVLDTAGRMRHQRLAAVCAAILQTADGSSGPMGGTELRSGGLDQLLWIFLKLLVSRQRIAFILSQTSQVEIEKEIAATSKRLEGEAESSALGRSLKGTLDIQKRRLENLLKARESLAITEAEIDRIEKQVALMREELTVSSDPEMMTARLDGIVDSLQGTTKWMSDNDELFGQLDGGPLSPELLSEIEGGAKKT